MNNDGVYTTDCSDADLPSGYTREELLAAATAMVVGVVDDVEELMDEILSFIEEYLSELNLRIGLAVVAPRRIYSDRRRFEPNRIRGPPA